jgi:hypothetical protein
MAMGVQPAERGFGEVDGDAATPRRHAGTTPWPLARQFPLDQFALHANRLSVVSASLAKSDRL